MLRSFATLACLTAVAAPVGAQSIAWSLADGQAALFDRVQERTLRATEPAPAERDAEAHSWAIPFRKNGGVLLRADLDDKARTPQDAPRDLLEILPRIAFDLRTWKRGKVRETLDGVHPFGPLRIDGDADKPADDGTQELHLDLSTADAPAPKRGAPPNQNGHVLRTTLIVVRHFDAERGLVDRFTATLEGSLGQPAQEPVRTIALRIRETWTLREIVEADSALVRERIGDAIRRGVEAIEETVRSQTEQLQTTAPPDEAGHSVDHVAGELALGLLTMVKGGVPRTSESIQAGFEALRHRPLRDTYTLGVALMAFEALYADPNERENIAAGLLDRPQPRTPTDADKALMQTWVERLLENRDRSVDRGYTSRWNYTGGEGYDNSNTQYALLGLYSAQLCGIKIPTSIWLTAGKHFVDQQCPDEGPHALSLTTQRQLRAEGRSRRTVTKVPARGWSYTYANAAPYGSMTAAGISSLTICLAALRDTNIRGGEAIAQFQMAVRAGWAWFGANFRIRGNPGQPGQYGYHHYYYLYGLERACELNQVARIDDRDWYFEGACILLEAQMPDGHFEHVGFADNCFAVLFLKKASLAVFTGDR